MIDPLSVVRRLAIPLLLFCAGTSGAWAGEVLQPVILDSGGSYSIAEQDSIYLNLGAYYRNVGNFNASTAYFYNGLTWSEGLGLDSLRARYLTNIGVNHSRLRNYDQSLQHYRSALDIYQTLQDTLRQSFLLNNISLIYRNQHQYDTALDYYRRATAIKMSLGLHGSRLNQNSLAFIYRDLQDYDSAIYYHKVALEHLKEEKRKYYEAATYNYLGEVFLLMNLYDSAVAYYREGYQRGRLLNAMETLQEATKGISDSYRQLGDYDSAYHFLAISNSYQDSLRLKKDIKVLSEMEAIYNLQSAQDSFELKNAKSQLAIQRRNLIILLISFVTLTVAAVALFLVNRQKRKLKATQIDRDKNELIHRQTINQLLKEWEVKSMRAFIGGQEQEKDRIARDLHDGIGGTLASLKIGLQRIGPELDHVEVVRITDGLDKACNEVRAVAHNLSPPRFRSSHFTGVLMSFIGDIGRSSLEIHADLQDPDELNALDERLQVEIYRIVQEVVSNVVKHAEAQTVDLQLLKVDGLVNLAIEDDGKGFAHADKTRGLGIPNIASRVTLLGGQLNIDSRVGRGTIVNIDFPV